MFTYCGSKQTIVSKYPAPRYPLIIEPFCGAAWYSLHHKEKQIWINDYEPRIHEAWQYIIKAQQSDIDSLPDMKAREYVTSYTLTREQRSLLRLVMDEGGTGRSNMYHGWAVERDRLGKLKSRMALYCTAIRHWKATNRHYRDIPNQVATWFIDPPYIRYGKYYSHGSEKIDYKELADWCKSRLGQIIVCEGMGAKWLPFRHLDDHRGRGGRGRFKSEYIWTNEASR